MGMSEVFVKCSAAKKIGGYVEYLWSADTVALP
jgi:hypothetical protein